MSGPPQLLLAHHLKALKLPTFLREHDKVARQCAAEGVDHIAYLLRLAELELLDRERRMIERRIREARFPAVKSLDSFDFTAIPALNKMLVLELARGAYVEQRENVIALGPSGTGKTHVALGLGLAACQKGLSVGFVTAAALVHELLEATDERRLLRLQKQLAAYKLLIVDELGYVPLSPSGAELLFEVFSRRYERGSVLVTSNLPFDEWTLHTAHGAAARSNTGAGQTSAQVPQNVHSPRVKSTSGRPLSPPSRIPSGQARLQASHRVHSSPNWSSRAQGGRIGDRSGCSRPESSARRDPAGRVRASMAINADGVGSQCRWARRAGHKLIHPDQEAVAADHHHGQDRRQHDREQEEHAQLLAACRRDGSEVCGYGRPA